MSDGKIVSIHSFRGGTGKSNTTANLAAQVALAGKRVGVVDTDIQSPGIHVLFGLDEQKMGKTLNDFLHGSATIREVGFPVGENPGEGQGRAQLKGSNLFLFPSSIKGGEISKILKEGIDFNVLNEGLQTAISEFDLDYLFIDTHPGLNEETLLSIATSDVLIVILRPDNQDLQGTAVTVDIARSLDVPNLLLLVNKALPKHDPAAIKVRRTRHQRPAAFVRHGGKRQQGFVFIVLSRPRMVEGVEERRAVHFERKVKEDAP